MKITLTMELTAENLEKLKSLIPAENETYERLSLFDSPSEAPVEQPKAEDPVPVKLISKSDIREVALKLSKAGKQDVLAEIFKKFGCKKLSDFDDRTEDYSALMKELVSANG